MAATDPAFKDRFDRKTLGLCRVLEAHSGRRDFGAILVVGCGDGREAATLAGHFGARTTGIDIADTFDAEAKQTVDLRVMDATALGFPDAAFDLVYSFHALEHIPDDRAALREMNRVLKPGGVACIGTPNRLRWVGYLDRPPTPGPRSDGTSRTCECAPSGGSATNAAPTRDTPAAN